MKKIIYLSILAACVVSCYPMPDEHCYSTVPLTNNPQVVPQHGTSFMPSVNY